jgi:hypothetical protein
MPLEGFVEYKRREFCNDVKCPVQMELNRLTEKSKEYERVRLTCSTACVFTTWQFHHWLIEKGYIILVSLKLKNNQVTVLANIDKSLVAWIDQQVHTGNYGDKNKLIENALAQYKKSIEDAK